jgi:hypothetical protein
MHALTAWDLKFQVCVGYTFTPATLATGAVLTLATLGNMTQSYLYLLPKLYKAININISTININAINQITVYIPKRNKNLVNVNTAYRINYMDIIVISNK